MLRDLLGNRIRKNVSLEMQQYMEQYYVYNDKIFQIIRVDKSYRFDGGYFFDMLIQNIKTKKLFFKSIPEKVFKEKKLSLELPKIKQKKFFYNYCYFRNKEMKKNLNILEKLYELGYKNYSYSPNLSLDSSRFSIIKNGRIISTDFLELEYRNLFDFYKEK